MQIVKFSNNIIHSLEGISFPVMSRAEIIWPEVLKLLEPCVGNTTILLMRENKCIK